MASDDLVTVAKFASSGEAHIAQGALEAAGIPSAIVGETVNDVMWYIGPALGGVKVQVAGRDEARARQALQEARAKPPETDAAPSKCPHCGAAVEPGFEVCWSCGASVVDANGELKQTTEGDDALAVDTHGATPSPANNDESESLAAPNDNAASRAWRSAVFGLEFPPLMLYAGYLLAKLSAKRLSRYATWRYYAALGVAIIAILFWWCLFLQS